MLPYHDYTKRPYVEKVIHFYVPCGLDLSGLPEDHHSSAHYLLNLIHWQWQCYRNLDMGYVPLKREILQKFIPWRMFDTVRKYLTGTLDHSPQVIEWEPTYSVGSKCMGYGLAPNYRRMRRIVCRDAKLSHKINQHRKEQEQTWLPVHHWLWDRLEAVEFDAKRARKIIGTLFPDDGKNQRQAVP